MLTAVAKIKDINWPEQSAETADVTTHDSSGGNAEWIKTGLLRAGAFTGTLFWDPAAASHVALQAALASTAALAMSLTPRSAGEVLTFNGLVTKLGRATAVAGGYECSIEIQPTGGITATPAA